MDGKSFLRFVWVIEGILFFIMSFAIMLFSNKVSSLLEMSPYLFGLIALQATGAIGGSSLKRLTEGYKIRAMNGKKK